MQKLVTKIRKAALALGFLLAASPGLLAQTSDMPWNIQVYGTALQQHNEMINRWWKFDWNGGAGLSLNRYISPSFDGGLHLGYQDMRAGQQGAGNWYRANMTSASLGLRLKMYGTILKEDAFIGPYLSGTIGAGFGSTEGSTTAYANNPVGPFDKNYSALLGSLGGGIRLRFSDRISGFVQSSFMFDLNDGIDGREVDGGWDKYLQHNVGLGFNLGSATDTDGDGVPDRRDECPDTPTGVQVDRKGCPIDTDGDGVPDYQDQCPTEAGPASTQGCPDGDGDGVADKDDRCPTEPGTAALQGCPDSDGDGVADIDDQCPDTPAGVQVDAQGCPIDTDGDGIADHEDLCPNSAGPAENKGCPQLDERTLRLMEEKVRFEFDQARVQDGYRQLLDSIVVALERYPDHVLLIKGHADHIGSEEYNQALSERRAQAVKDYLISRGVQNPDRLVTRGYGESQPLVQVNTRLSKARTAAARAQNRRVGFQMDTPDMKLDME
ncbi:hypothetical protein C1N53_20780 [Pontibacter sp. SGAir0037]|nr:hypothetical protein C1N53_20780 [Pontibacter sp. SGAir0037]